MNEQLNFIKKENSNIENISLKESFLKFAKDFLGEEINFFNEEVLEEIISESEKEFENNKNNKKENLQEVKYNKYKKEFSVNEEVCSIGDIISARRLGINIDIPTQGESLKEKKLYKIRIESEQKEILFGKLNKRLAYLLADDFKQKNLLKSKAYKEIGDRAETNSKQFGIVAEKIIMSTLEGIAIDRQDLGFSVIEGNAFQDVENKIDFIIATKQKKRGVGINRDEVSFEEKSIGIQFTVNSSKREHKNDQINKAKERGVLIDDIVYVEIDQIALEIAISKWKKSGKPISGPWNFLPKDIKTKALTNLFGGILSEEQQKSLLKNLK